MIPDHLQHLAESGEQSVIRLKPLDESREVRFEDIAADRLAIARALTLEAPVIRMLAIAALGIAGCQRRSAVATRDEAAQGECRVEVGAGGCVGVAIQSLLHLVEGFNADDGFVLTFTARHVELAGFDHSSVNRAGQDIRCRFIRDDAALDAWELRLRLEEAFDLGNRLKAADGEGLQSLLHDRRQGLITNQELAREAIDFSVLVADRGHEGPEPVHHSGPHAVGGLLRVLPPLMLSHRGKDVFTHFAVSVIPELYSGRFENAASLGDRFAKFHMGFQATRQPRNIINYYSGLQGAMLAHEGKHLVHAGAL